MVSIYHADLAQTPHRSFRMLRLMAKGLDPYNPDTTDIEALQSAADLIDALTRTDDQPNKDVTPRSGTA